MIDEDENLCEEIGKIIDAELTKLVKSTDNKKSLRDSFIPLTKVRVEVNGIKLKNNKRN